MRAVLLAVLSLAFIIASAQTANPGSLSQGQAETKAGKKAPDDKRKPRPKVVIKKDGNVGDDAAGGRGGASSTGGGTPGTPSGSFTR